MNFTNKHNLFVSSAAIASILSGLVLANNIQSVKANDTSNIKISKQEIKATSKPAKLIKKSYLYNKHGKRIRQKALRKNKTIKVYGIKTIKGKKFYSLGHNRYIPVSKVKLAKKIKIINATAIYNRKGQKLRAKTLKKGKTIKVYNTKTIKGKKFYSLGNGQYIPVNNISVSSTGKTNSNSPSNDNNSNTLNSETTNSGSDNSNASTGGTTNPENSASGNNSSNSSSGTANPGNSAGNNSNNSSNGNTNSGNSAGNNSNNSSNGNTNPGNNNSGDPANNNTDTSTVHDDAVMILPKGYTREALYKAYNSGYPEASNVDPNFINACKQGVRINNFDRSKNIDQAGDDTTIVDPTNLTPDQQTELSTFALRLINQARACLNLHPWIQSTGTQQLANDIAAEYTQNNHSIEDNHYVDGIIRASKKNGLNIDKQYIEDMTAWGGSSTSDTMTLSQLKKQIYFGIKQCLFGAFTPSTYGYTYLDSEIDKSQNYHEWMHAGNLLSAGNNYGDDSYREYFALSISTSTSHGKEYAAHFIHVSSYFITGSYGKKNNCTFNPGKDPTTNTTIVIPNPGDEIAQKFSITNLRPEFIKILNQRRTNSGLTTVTEDPDLDSEAQNSADEEAQSARQASTQLVSGTVSGTGITFSFSPDPATMANNIISTFGGLMDPSVTAVGLGATVMPDGDVFCFVEMN